MAGKDPRVSPIPTKPEEVLTVATFLDQYFTNYVEAEGLKSVDTICGHIKALKAALGELPVSALEKPAEISRFKASYRHGHCRGDRQEPSSRERSGPLSLLLSSL